MVSVSSAHVSALPSRGGAALALALADLFDLPLLAAGYMRKDDILGIFDGSVFVVLAHRHKSGRGGGAFKPKKA